ncbi:MAG: hypothetical protein K6T83_16360 [Alicyclobacillus sp.]|nr:hypothetical protein [Alicyclobacillus sp.]
MRTTRWSAALETIAAVAACVWLAVGTTLASESDASFKSHYQHNAQIEASLLQKAQSVSSNNADVKALETTVQSLNQQIATLYNVEQTLAEAANNAPNLSAAEINNLKQQRQKLVDKAQSIQQSIRSAQSHHDDDKVKRLQARRASVLRQISMIDDELGGNASSAVSTQQFRGGLQQLQAVIYRLQAAAIHYTNQWIRLETNATLGTASSVSGLAYAETSLNIPHDGVNEDVVASQPIVKDQNGNILDDIGVYTISRSSGSDSGTADGVTIDAVSGTVTVHPGAAAGSYTVTYTQGDVSEQVTLILL